MRKKRSPLDTEIFVHWDELAFRDGGFAAGPCSEDEYIRRCRSRQGEWQALLDRAYLDGQWIADLFVASTLSGSLWFQHMGLCEYESAEQDILRLLTHPESPNADRSDKAEWPIMLQVARLAQGDQDGPPQELAAHIEAGPYRPGMMASHVWWLMRSLLADMPQESEVSDSMRDLARSMAEAKRASKRRTSACAGARTVEELTTALEGVF